MSRVRPLERGDLPELAALYERVARSGGSAPPAGLAPALEGMLFDNPWADPETPSLVYEGGDGRILAFVGAHARRIRFDGEPARLVCVGQLASEPAARRRGAGTVLLRNLLEGPQDLTLTDGATPTVTAMWEPLGGRTALLRSLVWMRVLRPGRALRDRLQARELRGWSGLAGPLAPLLDAVGRGRMRPSPPDGIDPPEDLTAEAIVDELPQAAADVRLHVDYDAPFLRWLFEEMRARSGGELVRRCVRRGGSVAGWYVAYLNPGGFGQVMQLVGRGESVEAVLDALLAEAWESGTAALQGRLEPHLFDAVSRRRCLLRHGDRVMFHSRHPAILDAVAAERTLLTRMDGEWWMGFDTEPF